MVGNVIDVTNTRLFVIGLNVACTEVAPLTVTVQSRNGPEQPAPDQPEKKAPEPLLVRACSLTEVPAAKAAVQVVPQLIPAGIEVTLPAPPPARTTVRP